jgi:hypothetical protein
MIKVTAIINSTIIFFEKESLTRIDQRHGTVLLRKLARQRSRARELIFYLSQSNINVFPEFQDSRKSRDQSLDSVLFFG